jgi:hypothetical protein
MAQNENEHCLHSQGRGIQDKVSLVDVLSHASAASTRQ